MDDKTLFQELLGVRAFVDQANPGDPERNEGLHRLAELEAERLRRHESKLQRVCMVSSTATPSPADEETDPRRILIRGTVRQWTRAAALTGIVDSQPPNTLSGIWLLPSVPVCFELAEDEDEDEDGEDAADDDEFEDPADDWTEAELSEEDKDELRRKRLDVLRTGWSHYGEGYTPDGDLADGDYYDGELDRLEQARNPPPAPGQAPDSRTGADWSKADASDKIGEAVRRLIASGKLKGELAEELGKMLEPGNLLTMFGMMALFALVQVLGPPAWAMAGIAIGATLLVYGRDFIAFGESLIAIANANNDAELNAGVDLLADAVAKLGVDFLSTLVSWSGSVLIRKLIGLFRQHGGGTAITSRKVPEPEIAVRTTVNGRPTTVYLTMPKKPAPRGWTTKTRPTPRPQPRPRGLPVSRPPKALPYGLVTSPGWARGVTFSGAAKTVLKNMFRSVFSGRKPRSWDLRHSRARVMFRRKLETYTREQLLNFIRLYLALELPVIRGMARAWGGGRWGSTRWARYARMTPEEIEKLSQRDLGRIALDLLYNDFRRIWAGPSSPNRELGRRAGRGDESAYLDYPEAYPLHPKSWPMIVVGPLPWWLVGKSVPRLRRLRAPRPGIKLRKPAAPGN